MKKENENSISSQELFLLKTFYKKMIEIFNVFCGLLLFLRDEQLNYLYVKLLEIIEKIFSKSKSFKNLRKKYKRPFDDLIGNMEDADIEWENGISQETNKFYTEIETLFIKHGKTYG